VQPAAWNSRASVPVGVHPERLRHLPVAVRLALGGTWLLVRHGGHLLTLGSAGGVGL